MHSMLTRHTIGHLIWIDLSSPTREEVKELMERYALHPTTASELLSPTVKPRVDSHDTYLFLILHFPALRHTHKTEHNQEVDFIIGDNFLITVRYDTIDPLHKFAKMFEVNEILAKDDAPEHAVFIFVAMIQKLYRALIYELEYVSDALEDIEKRIFTGQEKSMVFALSHVSRDLIRVKQALGLHEKVLASLREASESFFPSDLSYHVRSVGNEYHRARSMLQNNMNVLNELRETNNSLVSTSQNEVMKIVAILAFVTFPLSLVASIFGMNTKILPIVGSPNDFWIIISFMILAAASFFMFFKYKKWL